MSSRSLRARVDRLDACVDGRMDVKQMARLMRLVCEEDPDAMAAIAAGVPEGGEQSPWGALLARITTPEVER